MISIELYRLNVSTPGFERISTIHDAFNITWQKRLNDYGRASFSLNLFSIMAVKENLLRFRTQVVMKSGNSILWVGFISHVSASIEGVNGVVNIECLEYPAHLATRFTDAIKIYTEQPLEDIIWDLVDTTQNKTNGDLLITRGNSPSLIDSQITYEYKPVIEAIIDYSNNINGFDFDFSYTQDAGGKLSGAVINLYTSLGSRRDDLHSLIIGENIDRCELVTKGNILNAGTIEGAGTMNDVIVSTSENTSSQLGYTRREVVVARKDISNKDTLTDKIDAIINSEAAEKWDISVRLKPTSDLSQGYFSIGDTLNLAIGTSPQSYLSYTGNGRVVEIDYSVDSVGAVMVTPKLLVGL